MSKIMKSLIRYEAKYWLEKNLELKKSELPRWSSTSAEHSISGSGCVIEFGNSQ